MKHTYRPPERRAWNDFLARMREANRATTEVLRLRAARGLFDHTGDDNAQLPFGAAIAVEHPTGRMPFSAAPGESQRRAAEPVRPKAAHGPGRNAACPCGSGRKFKQCCRGK